MNTSRKTPPSGQVLAIVAVTLCAVLVVLVSVTIYYSLQKARIKTPIALAEKTLPKVEGQVKPKSGHNSKKEEDAMHKEIEKLRSDIQALKDREAADLNKHDVLPQEKKQLVEDKDNVIAKPEPLQAAKPKTTTAIAKEILGSVAVVEAKKTNHTSMGSGFVIKDKRYLITNYHVIEYAEEVTVVFQKTITAKVSGFLFVDKDRDIAVLLLDHLPNGVTGLTVSQQLPQQGEDVVTFGAPKGLVDTVSKGIVSGIREGKEVMDHGKGVYVQIDAPISPGNSGGPLVNMNGEVVGMNTWGFKIGQNLNFAISCLDISDSIKSASLRNLQALDRLPKMPPMIDAPMKDVVVAKDQDEIRKKIQLMSSIYTKRIELIMQWERAQSNYSDIHSRYDQAQANYNQLYQEAASVYQLGANLEQQIANLQSQYNFINLKYEKNDDERIALARIDRDIRLARIEYQNCIQRYQTLDAQAARLKTIARGLQNEASNASSEMTRVWIEAEQLRAEWLAANDAFGLVARGEYSKAITVFSEWIVLESSNPAPYIMRGLVYLQKGDKRLSDADFNKAIALDPQNAGKNIAALKLELAEINKKKK